VDSSAVVRQATVDVITTSDPTGTSRLRVSFRVEAFSRLRRLRRQIRGYLAEREAAQLSPLLTALFARSTVAGAGQQVSVFSEWMYRVTYATLVGDGGWMRSRLEAAYASGARAGAQILGVPEMPSQMQEAFFEHARIELEGIADALTQQVARAVARAEITRERPSRTLRQVLAVLRVVGERRLTLLVNTFVVQLHNAARLDQFREAGHQWVGVVPETRPTSARRPRLDHAHVHDQDEDYVNVETAGDDLVCQDCEDYATDGPYSVDEVDLPVHPSCRCAVVPASDMRFALNRAIEAGTAEETEL
jgi:hypothetical protein